ncbi:hypothetical protein KUCAC02_018336 [Chaenocephalus aceratus]|uniref:Uncharacterized protein n=1 Tax=Chaenocephalus aceratus TaxID=36190 RepID=A0ACB9W890_CHAAC|nr:hypothetical protein KUCAC02_018336 [Chaenocephalus aceratus]
MEAQYHPICRNNFNNDYQNHERGRKRGKNAADNIDSPQARKMAAHDKSYCVVKDYILRNVVDHKEVVQLRSMCNLYRKTLEESKELPWPPTAQELDAVKMDELLPEHLVQFLSSVVTGTLDEENCEKTQRLVYSITQDVCRAATNSKWKLPKHILLCATLRHLYRSKQLTTILSRLGHSETYDFSMELETAMANAFDEMSTNLTPQIITGEGTTVFHSEWDNLNRITTNVHGSNVVNSAGGIMIQEVKESHVSTKKRTLPLYDRSSKMRNLKITPPETLPELAFKRVGPKFPKNANFTPPAENQYEEEFSKHVNLIGKFHTAMNYMGDYLQYQDKVRRGHLGKTGMFWLSMMDHARLVFMMDFAVKTNNFELFHHCNGAMADLFFAYLTWFEAFLTNIDLSHPGALDYIKLGAIAVARSLIPGALAAVDKTMEETFMRFAKTSGGLLGLFNNCGAYQKRCRTTSARAQLYELTLEMCGMIDDPEMPKTGKHRELEPAQIKKSELAVQSEQFIQERFISKRKDFFDRLKKLTLKTMDYCSKRVKLTSAQGKLFVYKEQSNLAFQLLVTSQIMEMPINLEELMRYPLSPRAESEEHAALDKVTDYANNNLSVGEVNGEYEHEDEELEMEEIELEDLFSDDEDDE